MTDDGSLSPSRRRWLDVHLARCPSCRQQLRELEQLKHMLRRAAAPAPPEALVDAIVGQVRFREANRRRIAWRKRFWQGAGVGLTVAVVTAAVWLALPRLFGPSEPAFASTVEAVVSRHSRQARQPSWPLPPMGRETRRRANFAPALPGWVPPGYAFVEGGVGALGDRQIIHWRFDDGSELLSVFQMPAKDEDRRRHREGGTEVSETDGLLVASALQRGYLFVVVGRLSVSDAEAMLSHMRPAEESRELR